jgi:peptidoglycan/xylan/chitin deacetylase (PgdA/CDA1 family)
VRRGAGEVLRTLWHHAGLAGLARRLHGARGAILRYHSVTDDETGTLAYLDRGLIVTASAFRRQLGFLRRHYRVLGLDEMVECLHAGRMLPPRAVAITFDDGYLDNYTHAFPALCASGLPATFYVTTGAIDGGPPLWTAKLRYMVRTSARAEVTLPPPFRGTRPVGQSGERQAVFTELIVGLKQIPSVRRRALVDELADAFGVQDFSALDAIMMTWAQLREMSANGMTIGAHTVSHPNLPNTEVEEALREVRGSREMIEGALRTEVVHFSYPNGRGSAHVNDTIRAIVRRVGFLSAVTSLPGSVQAGADPWGLRRVGIYHRHGDLRSFSLDLERARLRG